MHLSNIHDAKTQLSALINRALAGEEVIIARAGQPLVPLVHDPRPREGGQLRGHIRMAEDFDAYDEAVAALFGDDAP